MRPLMTLLLAAVLAIPLIGAAPQSAEAGRRGAIIAGVVGGIALGAAIAHRDRRYYRSYRYHYAPRRHYRSYYYSVPRARYYKKRKYRKYRYDRYYRYYYRRW
jgi:hypothetical protein